MDLIGRLIGLEGLLLMEFLRAERGRFRGMGSCGKCSGCGASRVDVTCFGRGAVKGYR